MPLLLLDLDNTLIDREAAYRRWAVTYSARIGRPPTEANWLIAMDRDGAEKRERLAELICLRYELGSDRQADVVDELRRGLIEHLEPDAAVPAALDQASAAGWTPVVVTNGAAAQQERKLHRTGLAGHVAGWVISEAVGLDKPDPRIFQLAAEQVGQDLTGAWMIGDSPEHDIGGAHEAGLASVWLHRGRTWELPKYAPTFIADNFAGAIEAVLTEPHPAGARRPRQLHQRRDPLERRREFPGLLRRIVPDHRAAPGLTQIADAVCVANALVSFLNNQMTPGRGGRRRCLTATSRLFGRPWPDGSAPSAN